MTERGTHFSPSVTSHRGYDDTLSIYGILELVPPSRSGHATAGGYLKPPAARTAKEREGEVEEAFGKNFEVAKRREEQEAPGSKLDKYFCN